MSAKIAYFLACQCLGFNTLGTIHYFGDESFQAINCAGNDNQKQ